MILRIIDKDTQLFKRDDFKFDSKTEIGLNVKPSQGLSTTPKWHCETIDEVEVCEWVESGIPYVAEEL